MTELEINTSLDENPKYHVMTKDEYLLNLKRMNTSQSANLYTEDYIYIPFLYNQETSQLIMFHNVNDFDKSTPDHRLKVAILKFTDIKIIINDKTKVVTIDADMNNGPVIDIGMFYIPYMSSILKNAKIEVEKEITKKSNKKSINKKK